VGEQFQWGFGRPIGWGLTKVFVAYDRGEGHGIPVWSRIRRHYRDTKMFNDSVYGTNHDQSRAQVHGNQHTIHVPILDAAFSATAVEFACDADEAEHDENLGYERDFHEDVAEVLLFLWNVRIN